MIPNVGDVRVVRHDKFNFATERYVEVKTKAKDGEPESVRHEWQVVGYHGENLKAAALFAIRQGAHGDNGQQIIDALKRAESVVLNSLKDLQVTL